MSGLSMRQVFNRVAQVAAAVGMISSGTALLLSGGALSPVFSGVAAASFAVGALYFLPELGRQVVHGIRPDNNGFTRRKDFMSPVRSPRNRRS